MYRIMMLAALMLSMIGGLWVMSGSAPLAAQTPSPSATRSFSSSAVAPGEQVMVTIVAADYGSVGIVVEELPAGFVYVSSDAERGTAAGQTVTFVMFQQSTFTYVVTASSTAGSYSFSGILTDGDEGETVVGGELTVTVGGDPVTPGPDATPTAVPALAIPDLDNLPANQTIFSATDGNSVAYTAKAGAPDAKVVARVSPGAEALVIIDLGMAAFPDSQKINFSLTDGANLDFQIKKTGPDTARIVAKDGVDLTSGRYNFQLVVNEFGNAPANTEDVDVQVHVVIDNEAPTFTDAPASGTVAERAMDAAIATFSASDVNNQVLSFKITANVDEETGLDAGAARILPSLVIGAYSGVLKTDDSDDAQPDYIEDDPETADADESADANEHVFIITVSDGTSDVEHEFTLTVTDVDDPPPGSKQILPIKENNAGGVANYIGLAPALSGGEFSIGEQVDSAGNIAGSENPEDILFDVDASSGKVFLREAGSIDYESGIRSYTLAISRGNMSGIVVVRVQDVNEGPEFKGSDKEKEAESDSGYIGLFVLESASVGAVVGIGQDAGNNPRSIPATFTASDQDSAATGNSIAYDLWHDDPDDDPDAGLELYAGADAMFTVSANGTIQVNSMLDTDADNSVSSIDLVLRAVDAGEQGNPPDLTSELKSVLHIRVSVIDTNVAPEFDAASREKTHATVSEGAVVGTAVHTYRATDEDGDPLSLRLRDQDDAPFFSVEDTTNNDGEVIGVLKTADGLDYEAQTSHTVEIQVYDTDGDTDEIVIEIEITNENDETPTFLHNPLASISVVENTARGMTLGNSYEASDPDGFDITYSLTGADAKSFQISDSGVLMTLESLDYDRPVPCGANTCNVTVNASDGAETLTMNVAIAVTPSEDSVSTLSVTKANPVPGTTMGDAMTALGNTKTSMSVDVPERPADLPNATGAPLNFVETDWANWGTVLRIQVTAQSPDVHCGSGNECVIISLNSDSADDTLKVQAYRMDTPAGAASNENKFVAAVMLVELDGAATDVKDSGNNDIPVYKHTDGSVPRLQVDEEDEIEIEFYNLRGDIEVENEAPEISNFAPEHESAFDDAGRGLHLHGDGQPFRLARA